MSQNKELLRVRILLTVGVLALIGILSLIFFKLPDNFDATFVYESDGKGNIVILGYTGDTKKLTIPSEIDGKKVISISSRAFGSTSSILESVTVGEGIEHIDEFAFYSCQKLTKVSLPSTLRFIGEGAFGNCKYLKTVNLPESLETIDDSAFEGCMMLSHLKIPASVKTIGTDAFMGCESLYLDVSESPVGREFAEKHSIPTSFADSGDYSLLISVISVVSGIAIFFVGLLVCKKILAKRKAKSQEE